jgi:hypothetical protein
VKCKGHDPLPLTPKKRVKASPVKVFTTSDDSTGRKPNFCFYCDENKSNNIRVHLESKHSSEEEMQKAHDTLDKEYTKKMINALVTLGNQKHNKLVLENKAGILLPAKRSKTTRRDVLMQCFRCNKMLSPKHFNRHQKKCKIRKAPSTPQKYMRQSSPSKKAAVVNVKGINLTAKNPQGLASNYAETVRLILHNMRDPDKEIENFLNRDDDVIAEMVQSFVTDHEGSNNYFPIVRRQIRLLMGLVKAFESDPSIAGQVTKLRDLIRREIWQGNEVNRPNIGSMDRVTEIVVELSGGTENGVDFQKPNDVMSYSSILRQLIHCVRFSRLGDGSDRPYWEHECDQFLNYIDSKKWSRYTTKRAGAQKRRNQKINKIYVDLDDLALYKSRLESECETCLEELLQARKDKKKNINHEYMRLAKRHSLVFAAFNARRAVEPNYITLANYKARNNFAESDAAMMDEAQTEMAMQFDTIVHTGKSRQIMSLVKRGWRKYLEVLADPEIRKEAGIPDTCHYLYGSTSTAGKALDTRHLQEKIAIACGAKKPKFLRSRYIRTTFATTMGRLKLSHQVLQMLCLLMGHTMGVHLAVYDLPTGLNFSLLMGKACNLFDLGEVNAHKGETLEDVMHLPKAPPPPPGGDSQ